MRCFVNFLDDLFVLQQIDIEIAQLRASQQRLPQKLHRRKKEVQDAKKQLDDIEEEIKKKKVLIKDRESLLMTCESNIEKKKVQLNSIKTNREYTGLLEEIKNIQKEKSQLEDTVLEAMEGLEKQKEMHGQVQKHLEGVEKEYREFKEQVEIEMKQLESEMAEVQKKRSAQRAIVESQDSQTLRFYEKVLSVNFKYVMFHVL